MILSEVEIEGLKDRFKKKFLRKDSRGFYRLTKSTDSWSIHDEILQFIRAEVEADRLNHKNDHLSR